MTETVVTVSGYFESDPSTTYTGIGHAQVDSNYARITGTVELNTLTIDQGGTLEFDPDNDTTLLLQGNLINRGILRMKPAHAGVSHKIVWPNIDETRFVGGGMVPLDTDVGLWAIGDGVLDLHGTPRTPWRRTTGSLGIGATSLMLDGDVIGWQPGDELAITPTALPTSTNFSNLYDYPKIVSIQDRVVTFTPALKFGHPKRYVNDGLTLTAEVMNLTRNVMIEGTPGGRAHVFIAPEVDEHGHHGHTTGQQKISHVAFRYMGPRRPLPPEPDGKIFTAGVLGRYGPHFHHNGAGSAGSEMTGLVARNCGSHAFVSHRSDGITWTECIAHDVFEDPYWYDQAVDTFTPQEPTNDLTYDRCVASLVRTDPPNRGYRLAGFTLGNGTGNRCIDSVAVGVQGTRDASGFHWPEGATDVWLFTGCMAHNNAVNGIFTWQNTPEHHLITDFIGYHNGGAGISHGAYVNVYVYNMSLLIANKLAALDLHSNSHPDAIGDPMPRQVFEQLFCDQQGLSDYCVRVLKHTVASDESTNLVKMDFRGYRKAPVGFVHIPTPSQPTTAELLDIIDCPRDRLDLPWAEFLAPLKIGSRVRVIENSQVVEEWP